MNVDDEAGSLVSTQELVLGGSWDWTRLTRSIPGFTDIIRTTADFLRHVKGELVLARIVVVTITHTLSHVHAVISSIDLHVLGWTDACVVSKSVVTGSRSADANVSCAFVDIFTDAGLFVEVVAVWTFALEAAKCIDTVATLAQTRKLLAFVDVF